VGGGREGKEDVVGCGEHVPARPLHARSSLRGRAPAAPRARAVEPPDPFPHHIPTQFTFVYSVHEHPSMSNDSITINRRQAADHQVKLAICHALAQVRAAVGGGGASRRRVRVRQGGARTVLGTRALFDLRVATCKTPRPRPRQSTKLCVYEERVVDLVLRTKHLPQVGGGRSLVLVGRSAGTRRVAGQGGACQMGQWLGLPAAGAAHA
jgi:hypothetical protein